MQIGTVVEAPDVVSVDHADARRNWALLSLVGGGIAMTIFASIVLYRLQIGLIQPALRYTYYLGMAAMVQILLIFTGLTGLLVKRNLKISRTGIEIADQGPDLIPRPDAEKAVKEAVKDIPSVSTN